MTLKELRLSRDLSQEKAAELCGVSRKSYIKYEKDESTIKPIKLKFFYNELGEYGKIDETHGILSLDQIKSICATVLKKYDVDYCILFGSYSKGKAKEDSDVDLLISSNVRGMYFFGLVEELREALNKKVDVLDLAQLNNNIDLVKEILKDGIKIYG